MKKLSRGAVHEASHFVILTMFNHEITEISLGAVKYRISTSSQREIVLNSVRSITDSIQDIIISSAGMVGEYLVNGPTEFWKHSFPIEIDPDYICIRDATRKENLQKELKSILVLVSNLLSLPTMLKSIIDIATIIDQKKVVDGEPITEKGKRHFELVRNEILFGIENTETPEDYIPETELNLLEDKIVKEREPVQLFGVADLLNQIVMSIDEKLGE